MINIDLLCTDSIQTFIICMYVCMYNVCMYVYLYIPFCVSLTETRVAPPCLTLWSAQLSKIYGGHCPSVAASWPLWMTMTVFSASHWPQLWNKHTYFSVTLPLPSKISTCEINYRYPFFCTHQIKNSLINFPMASNSLNLESKGTII